MSDAQTTAQETTPAEKGAEAIVETTETATAEAAATGAKETTAEATAETEAAAKAEALKNVVPEKYDLKLPENAVLKAGRVEEIAALAKEKGLSNDMAQQLLESENSAVASFQKEQLQEFEANSVKWKEELLNDPEIGGDKYTENVELAHRALAKFGDEQFSKNLVESGLANHPGMVRTFLRIGKAMQEDKLVIPPTHTNQKPSAPEDVLYPAKQ